MKNEKWDKTPAVVRYIGMVFYIIESFGASCAEAHVCQMVCSVGWKQLHR